MAQESSDMTNPDPSNCPQCGNPISEDAPSGLCPACVLAKAAITDNQTNPNPKSPPPSPDELAAQFPDLEILEIIGVGGMGAVYKARQPKLDRNVALKILQVHDDDPAFEERFNREARVLARLNHPNIVTVFDFGTSGPYHFLIMELIDGVNLRQAMQAGRFSSAEALTLIQEMCAALKSAHEDGILHRDIKPENILLDSQGRLKIADFGIAKLLGPNEPHNFTLTRQDSLLGSPQYMAPEQIETPDDVDQRADIYSLGVVFYELLTGELPLGRFPAPSTKNDIDSRIDDIVFRTLEKERDARFQSAEEVSTKVESLSQSPPPLAIAGLGKTARFATISALLTSISIPLIYICFFTLFSSHPEEASNQSENAALFWTRLIGISGMLLAITTVTLGFSLGTSALSDIRQSNGQKRGLSRATFAVLTWPILFLLGIISAFIPGPMETKFTFLILLISFGVICWALIPTLRRWARSEQSLSPIFMRLIAVVAIPVLLSFGAVDWLTNVRDQDDGSRRSLSKSFVTSNDSQTRELAGKLEAALQLPPNSQKSLTIASIAVEIALAGKPKLAEHACAAVSIDSVRSTARYKCALILGRQGFTSDASAIAGKITQPSLKRTALLKIAKGEFDDNSIPPPSQ
jgi:serine/threonine protein kinase